MGTTIDRCRTCKHAFTTGKDRWYCKKSLADKDDCGGYEMTREEKEQTGKYVLQMARLLEDGCYQQEMLLKAVHIIDEALEQEPVLDKLRAEVKGKIVKRPWLDFEDRERDRNDAFLEVLDIIDKYKAEQEKT